MLLERGGQTVSLYIPEKTQQQRVIERLAVVASKRDRSINYLIVEAILQYLDREGVEQVELAAPRVSRGAGSAHSAGPTGRSLTARFAMAMMARDRAMCYLTDRYQPLLIYIPEPR